MANAKRDENRKCTAMGITDDSSQDTRLLIVDSITNRLLIDITHVSNKTSTLNSITRDKNYKEVDIVIDDNDIIRPLQVDSRNDYLFVDLTQE